MLNKIKKKGKLMTFYELSGKALIGCAGGLIGFVSGGPLLAIPGVLLGLTGGHYLARWCLS